MVEILAIYNNYSAQASRLKHSWLENQVLDKTADFIVSLRHKGDWPILEREFPANIRDVFKLAGELEMGFSPAQLVDQLAPLQELSLKDKEKIKLAVHEAYLKSVDIQSLKISLEDAAQAMLAVLEELLNEWRKPNFSELTLRKAWEEVLLKACILRDCLDRLPKGVVLP